MFTTAQIKRALTGVLEEISGLDGIYQRSNDETLVYSTHPNQNDIIEQSANDGSIINCIGIDWNDGEFYEIFYRQTASALLNRNFSMMVRPSRWGRAALELDSLLQYVEEEVLTALVSIVQTSINDIANGADNFSEAAIEFLEDPAPNFEGNQILVFINKLEAVLQSRFSLNLGKIHFKAAFAKQLQADTVKNGKDFINAIIKNVLKKNYQEAL